METTERNRLITALLDDGRSLSEVQKILQSEHDIKLTYMELRLITSELEVDWQRQDEAAAEKEPTPEVPAIDEPAPTGTQVSVSKVVRPGAVFSGDVTFASGKSAEWYVDQFGRLGLNPKGGSGNPSEEDLREFQAELQNALHGRM